MNSRGIVMYHLSNNRCIPSDHDEYDEEVGQLFINIENSRRSLVAPDESISDTTFVYICCNLGIYPPDDILDLYEVLSDRYLKSKDKTQYDRDNNEIVKYVAIGIDEAIKKCVK